MSTPTEKTKVVDATDHNITIITSPNGSPTSINSPSTKSFDDSSETDPSRIKSPREVTKNTFNRITARASKTSFELIRTPSPRNSRSFAKSSITDDTPTIYSNTESQPSDDEPEDDDAPPVTDESIVPPDVYDSGKYGFDVYKQNFMARMNEDEMLKKCGGVEYEFYGDPIKVEQINNVNRPLVVDEKGNEKQESFEDIILKSFVDEPPYHVKECIRIATTDFTVAGIQNNELDFQEIKNEPDVQLDSNIEFEVDKPKEKPNNNESVSTPTLLKTQSVVDFKRVRYKRIQDISPENKDPIKIENISTEEKVATDMLDAQKKVDSFAELFEKACPVADAKRVLKIDDAPQDLFLSESKINDLKLDSRAHLLFTPEKLMFEVQNWQFNEPLYCACALYEEGVKITETFYFDISREIKTPENALFSINELNNKVVLLIKVLRIFKGELTDTYNDFYYRGEKVKPKDVQTLLQKGIVFDAMPECLSLFGWNAVRVVDVIKRPNFELSTLYPLKSDVSDTTLLQMLNTDAMKKFKPFICKFRFSISQVDQNEKKYVDASRLFIKHQNQAVIARELFPFQVNKQETLQIRNHFYVYPLSVQITNRNVKNIQVEVSLHYDGKNRDGKGLQVVYHPLKKQLVHEAYTEVNFKSKSLWNDGFYMVDRTPEFSTEIKMQLPCKLTPDHHLLFKFYNVAHKHDLLKEPKKLFGYSVLRIFDGKTVLSDETLELPMYGNLNGDYLSEPQTRIEYGKKVFKVRVKCESTVFPDDNDLSHFFRVLNSGNIETMEPQELVTAVTHVKDIGTKYVSFVPMLLDQLFLMVQQSHDDKVRLQAFQSIMSIVLFFLRRRNREHQHIIAYYIKYMFNFPRIHENLLQQILIYIDYTDTVKHNEWFLKITWFFFALILKSLVLNIHKSKNYKFSEQFHDNIERLLLKIPPVLESHLQTKPDKVKAVNLEVATFLKNLLSLMDRGYVMHLAGKYISTVEALRNKYQQHSDIIIHLELSFFSELLSYKNYVLLFLPRPSPSNDISPSEIVSRFENGHYIFTLFAECIARCLYNDKRENRMRAITVYREFLLRTNRDPRFQTPELKQRLHEVHFEFVLKLLDILLDWKNHCESAVRQKIATLAEIKEKIQQNEKDLRAKREALAQAKGEKGDDAVDSLHASLTKKIKTLERYRGLINDARKVQRTEYQNELQKSRSEKRHVLSCLIHIVGQMNPKLLSCWWSSGSRDSRRHNHFLIALQLCLQGFEYMGKKHLQETIEYIGSQSSEKSTIQSPGATVLDIGMMLMKMGADGPKKTPAQSLNATHDSPHHRRTSTFFTKALSRETTQTLQAFQSVASTPVAPNTALQRKQKAEPMNIKDEVERRLPYETNLSEQASLFVLKTVFQFIKDNNELILQSQKKLSRTSQNDQQGILENIMVVFHNFMSLNQSVDVMMITLSYLRYFLANYFETVYAFGETFCNDLMNLCKYRIDNVRRMAAALLYLFIRHSFEANSGIDKPRVMTTIALSNVLQNKSQASELKKSIDSIAQYASIDPKAPGGKTEKYHFEAFKVHQSVSATQRNVYPVATLRRRGHTRSSTFADAISFFKNAEQNKSPRGSMLVSPRVSPKVQKIQEITSSSPEPTPEKEKIPDPKIEKQTSSPALIKSTPEKLESETDTTGGSPSQRKSTEAPAKEQPKKQTISFAEDVEALCKRLLDLLQDTITVDEVDGDEEYSQVKEALLHRISEGYSHIPELRFIWLKKLAEYHNKAKQYVEAAQCYIRILAIVFEHLKAARSPVLQHIPVNKIWLVAPFLTSHINASVDKLRYSDYHPHSQEFTDRGIIKLLKTTIDYLEKAEYYEHAAVLYKILVAFFERQHKFKEIAGLYSKMQGLYEAIDQSIKTKNRYLATYWRIKYYGKKVEDTEIKGRNLGYVYKMRRFCKLNQLVKLFKARFQQKGEVELIDHSGKVDTSKLDNQKIYIQITSLSPYISETTPLTRKTFFERNTNINQFYFETPYKINENVEDSLALVNRYKKKTILTIEHHYPYVLTRLPIIAEEEIILTPIESALEDIEERNRILEDSLVADPPDVQTLMLVLQGAVRASVNGGPMDIVKTFLGSKHLYPAVHVNKLNMQCHNFLRLCGLAVKLQAEHISPEQRKLHSEIEKGYYDTKDFFEKYLFPVTGENLKVLPREDKTKFRPHKRNFQIEKVDKLNI